MFKKLIAIFLLINFMCFAETDIVSNQRTLTTESNSLRSDLGNQNNVNSTNILENVTLNSDANNLENTSNLEKVDIESKSLLKENSLESSNENLDENKKELETKEEEKLTSISELNAYEELINKYTYTRTEAELFGKALFSRRNSSLSLPSELEVGKDYVLSSGDVIQVNIFGDTLPNEIKGQAYNIPITLSGNLSIPSISSVNVRGKTILEVEDEVNRLGKTKYKDMKVEISLYKMRSVRVFVMGEVLNPGTYTLNPLSNLINAIYLAGGITDNSSLRNIKILRGGKTISIDMYDYLLEGDTKNSNLVLSEGDTIFLPVLSKKISIKGNIKRSAAFEIKNEKTISDILNLAGGVKDTADYNNIKVVRIENNEKVKIYETKKLDFIINNADIITVGDINESITNGVNIVGNILKPGVYEKNEGETLNTLIEKAGGFLPDTYFERADILRLENDTKYAKYSYSLETQNPVVLAGDTIFVYSLQDIGAIDYVRVQGAVKQPGLYKIYKNSRVVDAIFVAKGIKEENVYMQRADVLRLEDDGTITVIKINLKKAIEGDETQNIELKKFDTLKLYANTDINIKDYVQILGAVRNPGTYALNNNNNKLSDIVFEARGLNDKDVYMERADIIRLESDGSKTVIKINLEKALEKDTENDIELKKYDIIRIYKDSELGTQDYVQILGAVKNSGTYALNNDNNKLSDIIFEARGLEEKDVYLERAVIYRMDKLGDIQLINVNLNSALDKNSKDNETEDIELYPYDVVRIYRYDEVRELSSVYIYGEVKAPGKYQFNKNMTLDDLIFLAKQSTIMADLGKVEIIRLNLKTKLKEKMELNYFEDPNFILQEEDRVFIRKNKEFEVVKVVKITGNINYPGEYILEKDEDINSIIKRAGGFKDKSYPEGTKIIRKESLNRDLDRLNKRVAMDLENIPVSGSALTMNSVDDKNIEILNLGYNAKNKEYKNEIILKDGDEIVIPSEPSTVKIVGEVYFPRELGYEDGNKSFDYYIEAAGGLTNKAFKKQMFVIKADGKVEKGKNISKVKIEAGDTIVVPYDPREETKFNFFKDSLEFFQWLVTVLTAYALITN